MNIVNQNKPAFSANLLINDKKELLTNKQKATLKDYTRKIGTEDDIVELNLVSDVFDSAEINQQKAPKKFLSGYKLTIESTLDGFENFDASVAKTQQRFFDDFEALKPFSVIKNVLKNFADKSKLKEYQSEINDNPEIYNTENKNWHAMANIETPEEPENPVIKNLYNSPFYKALTNPNEKTQKIALIDTFKRNGMALSDSLKVDVPHGNFVFAILNQMGKNNDMQIEKFDVKSLKDKPCTLNPKSLLKTLKKVRERNAFNYVNLSVYYPSEYKYKGVEFKPEEIHQYREKILQESSPTIRSIINEIEKLEESGCDVYIAGGNSRRKFNLLSLAKGAHIIGGRDDNPLKSFTDNPLIENYKRLPVYIGNLKPEEAGKFVLKYPFKRDLATLSKPELMRRVAKKEDYRALKEMAEKMSEHGKHKFDLNFLEYIFTFSLDKDVRGKIFELKEYMRIFQDKFDDEIIKYVSPKGTHCDVQFGQFFDMNSKTKYVIPREDTTKIFKSISGSSFAAPQGLIENLQMKEISRKLISKNEDLYKDLLRYIR